MANNIALAKSYVPALDEVYKNAALTSDLDGAADLVKDGANANELVIPKIDMDGLADYSRNDGYVNGDVTLTYQTVSAGFDRGRMFNIDALDDVETAGVAYGRLAGEFIRTKVAPEVDAYRLATYASAEGVSSASGALTTAAAAVTAIRAALTKMDEDEVPTTDRILYITPTLKGLIDDQDNTKSRAIFDRVDKVVTVPQTRFYTAIAQNDGKTSGQEAGGYKKAADAKDINFMIIHKGAVIQFQKHIAPKVISPEQNQTSDGWKFGYRNVGIAEVYENKVAGIYVHKNA